MSQYDVAIGMDSSTLDKGISQLYANSQAREKLFKGVQEGTQGSLKYTANWDIQAAPTFILTPPPDDKWSASINNQGKHPTVADKPSQNTFQLVFPQFHAEYLSGSADPVSGTTEVIVFAKVAIQGDKAAITPLAVWLDESKMSTWDRLILNQILKQVLQKAETMLSGMQIPLLSFPLSGADINLTSPQVTITGSQLVLAASLSSKGSVDINGVTWPQQPLFVLMSADIINQVVGELARDLTGKTTTGSGDKSGGKYSYTAQLEQIRGIGVQPNDLTKINANAIFAFTTDVEVLGVPCSLTSATGAM